jgi:hypothetical protein
VLHPGFEKGMVISDSLKKGMARFWPKKGNLRRNQGKR